MYINMTNDEDNSNTYERNILTVCDVHQHDKPASAASAAAASICLGRLVASTARNDSAAAAAAAS